MNVVATADQRRSDQDRAGRVSLALDSVPTQADDSNRPEVRAEIRRILGEIEVDRAEIAELKLYRVKLEAELTAAESDHQAEAAKIQKTLAKPQLTTEQRVDARRELATINQALQRKCDDINSRIAAIDEEISEKFLSTCRADKAAKALRTTAEPSLLLELEAAEWLHSLLVRISDEASKRLSEHKLDLAYQAQQAEKRAVQHDWLPARLKPTPEKPMKASTKIPADAAMLRMQAEARAAAEVASVQAAKVAELTKQLVQS